MAESQINPRYSKYNNKEIEAILDSVAGIGLASEEDVRAIVTGYRKD